MLKTYEEAVCEVVGGCVFEWVDTGNLTSYEVNFDEMLNDYVLKLIGTGFNATLDNTEILIDNIK
jgi:protein involved in temperature-dependent protein secretion